MIRILQLTDLHVFAEPGTKLKGVPTLESLQEVVDWIEQQERAFDHIVVTGDHTHDERPESYRAVRAQLERLSGRRWQVPGNHDDRSVLRQVFPEVDQQIEGDDGAAFGATAADAGIRFSFRAGDWHCIGLDTHVPGEVSGRFDAEQERWLSDVLQRSTADQVVLFCHHPPIDVGSVWMDRIGLQQPEWLHNIVARDDRIQAIFCGHVHHDFAGQLHQAAVKAAPSTGIQFDPAGDVPRFAADPPGYRVIELNGTKLTSRVERLSEAKYVPTDES